MSKSKGLVEALSALIAQQPFFAVYLLDQMVISETKDIPTAATNGVKIIVNPEWFGKMTTDERMFVLAHEVLHGVFQHMGRAKLYMDRGVGPDLKKFNTTKFNHAADYVINDILVAAGVGKAPHEGLYHPNYGKDDLVDDVYVKLPDPPKDDKSGEGTGGKGDGFDDHMPLDPSEAPSEGDVKQAVASATNAAKAQGKMPGELERLVGDILDPKQNWKELLRVAIDNSLGRDEATWRRPNRRKLTMAPHVVMPGTAGYRSGKVGVVIDTSGSVSEKELTLFLSETAGILQDGKPEQCKVFWTDTKVAHIDEVKEPAELSSLKAHGGGGTDMEAAFPVVTKEFDYEPDVTTIVLTDGYTNYSSAPSDMNVIWVTTGYDEIPYGKVIKMDITHQ